MKISNTIHLFPKELKLLIASFLVVLSMGFYSGLLFVNTTSNFSANGIEENYNGNENNEDASVMKFKKSKRAMLSIIHSHILSMGMIFFFVGLILVTTNLDSKLKSFLMIEPFVSVILTFGGIYFLWKGYSFMKYIVIISGTLMTLTYSVSVYIIFKQLFFSKSKI
ncbi:MAG: hypothetical protein V3U80_05650 [Flavobacteriaceae bacterium]